MDVMIWFISIILAYVFPALCLMWLAKKTKTPNGWMAWVPILNIYLMCKIGGKSGIWVLWLLIPLVNIVCSVLVWSAIAQRVGKPDWWGILMLVPVANFVVMGVLAFSEARMVEVGVEAKPAFVPPPQLVATRPSVPGTQESKKFCSQCGTQVDVSAKFCPSCGAELPAIPVKEEPAKKFCPQCGVEVEPTTRFCPNCGTKLSQE